MAEKSASQAPRPASAKKGPTAAEIESKLAEQAESIETLKLETAGLRSTIDDSAAETAQLKNSIHTLVGAVNDISDKVAGLKEDARAREKLATPPAIETGQRPAPTGAVRPENPFDPIAMIEIAAVPRKGVTPQVFQFPDPDDNSGNKQLTYSFRMDAGKPILDDKGVQRRDEEGNPLWLRPPAAHYYMPRMFAVSQLRNDGGMKFVLVSPSECMVQGRGAKLNMEQRIVKADPDYQPPLF